MKKPEEEKKKSPRLFCPTIGGIRFILSADISKEKLKSLQEEVLKKEGRRDGEMELRKREEE